MKDTANEKNIFTKKPFIILFAMIAVLLWVFFDRIIRRGNNGN